MKKTIKIICESFLFIISFNLGILSSHYLKMAKEYPGSLLIYVPLVTLTLGYLLNKLLTWILKQFGIQLNND